MASVARNALNSDFMSRACNPVLGVLRVVAINLLVDSVSRRDLLAVNPRGLSS